MADSFRPPGSASPHELPLFRFGLRQLLLVVAGVSTLLAALVSLDGILVLALLLATMIVIFHVLSTALGSQLRWHAARNRTGEKASIERDLPRAASDSTAQNAPWKPRPPWYGRNASFVWLPRLVTIAAFLGGFLGAICLMVTFGHRTSLAGLMVGSLSLAALSGWFAFLGGNFVGIVRGGLREAVEEEKSNEGGRSTSR